VHSAAGRNAGRYLIPYRVHCRAIPDSVRVRRAFVEVVYEILQLGVSDLRRRKDGAAACGAACCFFGVGDGGGDGVGGFAADGGCFAGCGGGFDAGGGADADSCAFDEGAAGMPAMTTSASDPLPFL
jgi:hypothetical protein